MWKSHQQILCKRNKKTFQCAYHICHAMKASYNSQPSLSLMLTKQVIYHSIYKEGIFVSLYYNTTSHSFKLKWSRMQFWDTKTRSPNSLSHRKYFSDELRVSKSVFSTYQIPVFCPEHYAYYIQCLLKLIISLNKKLQRSQVSFVLHGCSAKYNNYHLSSSRRIRNQKSDKGHLCTCRKKGPW